MFIPFLRGSLWLRYKLLTPGPMSSTTFAIWDLTGAGMERTWTNLTAMSSHPCLGYKCFQPTLSSHPAGLCNRAAAEGWPRSARGGHLQELVFQCGRIKRLFLGGKKSPCTYRYNHCQPLTLCKG